MDEQQRTHELCENLRHYGNKGTKVECPGCGEDDTAFLGSRCQWLCINCEQWFDLEDTIDYKEVLNV